MSPFALRAALPLIAITFLSGCQGAKGTPGRTGEQGQQGPAGLDGATGAQGLVWRGAWASGTSYAQNDAVTHLGSAWIARTPTVGAAPARPAWDLLVPGGAVWRDATGAYVGPAMPFAVPALGAMTVRFADAAGNWWTLESNEKPVLVAETIHAYHYAAADCSGPAYIDVSEAPSPKIVVRDRDDTAYVVRPAGAAATIVDLLAVKPAGGACTAAALADVLAVPVASLVAVEAPAVTFVAPLHVAPE